MLLPPSINLTDLDILTSYDKGITKLKKRKNQNPYPFPIYNIENKYFAMQCVVEPIVALRTMKTSGDVKFVTNDTYKDEIKRFYKTLCEIIKNPPKDSCAKKGYIVPITVKVGDNEKLKDGGLTRIIIDKVNASNDRESEQDELVNESNSEPTADEAGASTSSYVKNFNQKEIFKFRVSEMPFPGLWGKI